MKVVVVGEEEAMEIVSSVDCRVIISLNNQVKWGNVLSVETMDIRRMSARSRMFASIAR
ncbi:hypothetical protein A2U01_0099523, partial [Trifolium medium]|nr:hypothetical protein [Trifolium medium]